MNEFQVKCCQAYIEGDAVTPEPWELAIFENWVERRFALIADRVDFMPIPVEPRTMLAVWEDKARLVVSTAYNEPALWSKELNAKFRAIHDWDHIKGGFGFDWAGEAAAAGCAMAQAPEAIRWMLWSEIALQAAVTTATGEFPAQKLVKV